MGIKTRKFIRKPLIVDAVRVTERNFEEMAAWCQGTVETDDHPTRGKRRFIRVRVHLPKNPKQTMAFVGDWILYTERGYKIYTHPAFRASFDEMPSESQLVSEIDSVITPPTPVVEVSDEVLADEKPPVDEAVRGEIREQAMNEPLAPIEPSPSPQPPTPVETPQVTDSPTAPPPVDTVGKRVLTHQEQAQMDAQELKELIQSGEVVLEQDLQPQA